MLFFYLNLVQNEIAADQSMVESGAISLLKTFVTPTESLTEKHSNRLLISFGPFSNITAKRAHHLVESIRNSLPIHEQSKKDIIRSDLRGILRQYLGSHDADEDDDNDNRPCDDGDCFGHGVKFIAPRNANLLDYEIYTPSCCVKTRANGDAAAAVNGTVLSFKISDVLNQQKLLNESKKSSTVASSSAGPSKRSTTANEFDVSTLIGLLSDFSENVTDICQSIISLLDSGKSDEMLQNDVNFLNLVLINLFGNNFNSICLKLFDLLGFDRFDLILSILQNRTQLVWEYNNLALATKTDKNLNAKGNFFAANFFCF